MKPPVKVATTTNITLSGIQTIDGVAVAAGDRVLVKDQSNQTENGVWVVASGAWSRANDFNGARDAVTGTQVFVIEGATNAQRNFFLLTPGPIDIGASALVWGAGGELSNRYIAPYQTAADLALAFVPGLVSTVTTAGHTTPGDGGGGQYVRVDTEPAHPGKVQSADGAWWELAPNLGGTIPLEAFGAVGDGTDDRLAILAAIDYAAAFATLTGFGAGGARIVGRAGAEYGFTGRLRMRSGVDLDLGRGNNGARLIALSTDAGVEQVAGSGIRAEMYSSVSGWTGPMLELDSAKSTEASYGRSSRRAWFDVGIRGSRQPGSRGLLITDDTGGGGVAWVDGKADIGECDYPCDLVSNGSGYVNENWLDIKTYDGIDGCRILVEDPDANGQIDANRIRLTTQTGADGRANRAMICDGTGNFIKMKVWDWAESKLAPGADGIAVEFTAKSGGNHATGFVPYDHSGLARVIDHSIRRNLLTLDSARVAMPSPRSVVPGVGRMIGHQDNMLAFADVRYVVTTSGSTPPDSTSIRRLFDPAGAPLSVSNCEDFQITVDLGVARSATEIKVIGLDFANIGDNHPDKVRVETSSNGTSWLTRIQHGYDGEPRVGADLVRVDGSGIGGRYLRLTVENDTPKTARIRRWFATDDAFGEGFYGAWAPVWRPTFYGQISAISLPIHADDTAAGSAGLTQGMVYQTATGELRIKT